MTTNKNYLLLIIVSLLFIYPSRVFSNEDNVIENMLQRGDSLASKLQCAQAVKLFYDAKVLAIKNNDKRQEFRSVFKTGVAYYRISANGEALNSFSEALKLCDKYKLGKVERGHVLNGISAVYFEEKDYEKAKKYMKEAFKCCVEVGDSDSYQDYAADLALIANMQGHFEESKHYTSLASKYLKDRNGAEAIKIKVLEADALYKQRRYNEVLRLGK